MRRDPGGFTETDMDVHAAGVWVFFPFSAARNQQKTSHGGEVFLCGVRRVLTARQTQQMPALQQRTQQRRLVPRMQPWPHGAQPRVLRAP